MIDYDARMSEHAKQRGAVLIRNGRSLQPATLLGWSVPGNMVRYRGRRAQVELSLGARVFVRQADVIMPEVVA